MIKRKPGNFILVLSMLFLFLSSCNISFAMAENKNISIPVKVGIVLDDLNSVSGKIWLSCIQMALSDFYASHAYYKTRLVLNVRNSKKDVVGAAAAALYLIKNEHVQAIIGPVTSMETMFVINLGNQAHVPILSFSATSPSLTSLRSSYFFQFAQNDSSQVKALGAIVKSFGWRQVVPIYIDTLYGEGIIPFLTDALQEIDARVPYHSVISPSATDDLIALELYKLMTMQTRVFIVHMTPELCSRLFTKAEEIGMMSDGYVWILASGITNSIKMMDPSVIEYAMQGVLGVKNYVPRSVELEEFKRRWKRKFHKDNPTIIRAEMDVFGLWAYDAAFALALASEKIWNTSLEFQKRINCTSSINSTDLDTFLVSIHGPKLSHALSVTRFKGIAGDFNLVGRQRQSSTFRIVNVNGPGSRPIGFWTPQNGLVKKLNSASSNYSLGPIVWPGDCGSVPKGWEVPTNGNKLRIGVPVNDGFLEFVKVTKDPRSNKTEVTGFCIDVFEAALKALPYALAYDYIPFSNPDGTSAGTYNDLCYQVALGNFDCVVGDTTIRADRALYVDFTMPYTESGVVMVVPFIDTRSRSLLAFSEPWTWELWVTTCCFFFFIGFVVWTLEHRINPDIREVGAGVWFSFSIIVFAFRERIVSNLARSVTSVWVFVVLILTVNYTASLTSIYTAQQLVPTVTDIMDLLRNEENVGYMKNSYVYDILKHVGFHDTKLKPLGTTEEIDAAFSKGSAKGGITAFVDETPYMKLFVAKYCSKYTMTPPIFKTDGFAFVFPKRSPLLPDVSQAILNVTGTENILKIENKWFMQERNCQNFSIPKVSSSKLGVGTFAGLFLIALFASILALIIFVIQGKMATLHGHEVRRPLNLLQDLKVTIHSSSLVLPLFPETEKKTIFLSNIDKLLNSDVQTVHFFAAHNEFPDSQVIAEKLKDTLAKILVPYEFLAGRLKSNPDTCRLEIDCNAAGAGFVVASSEYALDEINGGALVYPHPAFAQLVCTTMETPAAADPHDHPLFTLQVTTFRCGGFAMGISHNHTTLDGQSFRLFLVNLAALAADKPLAVVPYNDRQILAARSPPRVTFPHPELHERVEEVGGGQAGLTQASVFAATREELDFKIFRLTADDVAHLKDKAKNNNNNSFNVVTALIWQCKALSSSDSSPSRESTILYTVDIRRRLRPPLPEGYSGNAMLTAYASAQRWEVEEGPFSRMVEMVSKGATRVTDKYARSYMDWCELHKGFPDGEVLVSSWWRLGFGDVEYPWGKPRYSCPVVHFRKDMIALFPDQVVHDYSSRSASTTPPAAAAAAGRTNASNGVNILVALPPVEMQKFQALLLNFLLE